MQKRSKNAIVYIQCLSDPPDHSATQLANQGKEKKISPEMFLKEGLL